jgi:DinB superfamily
MHEVQDMKFDLELATEVLGRMPATLASLVDNLPDGWVRQNEGPGTWSVFDVLGHLIHGERTDWIPRARMILAHGTQKPFEPFDRFAQFQASEGRSLGELLGELRDLRAQNLVELRELRLRPGQLALQGRHPELGVVTLGQLLSTWVAHDLDHLAQIARVMAKCYADEVGPWRVYLRVLS